MAKRKLLYLDERPDFLDDYDGVRVIERYDFGKAGKAALVEIIDDDVADILYDDDRIKGYDDDLIFETQNIVVDDIEIQAGEKVSLEEQVPFHEIDTEDGNYGDGLTIGVMDSGIDPNKEVFSNTNIEYHDFTGSGGDPNDEVGHGTAVAGQIVNIAPQVDLVVLRVFGDSGRTSAQILFRAYEWIANNSDKLDYVNISLGSSRESEQFDSMHERVFNQNPVEDVVAAGNSGGRGGSPATAKKAFSVGALDINGGVTEFSSYNPNKNNPEVSGIGKNMVLVRAEGTSMGEVIGPDRIVASGTSFSAPTLTGLLAKLDSSGIAAPKTAISKYAKDVPNTEKDGAGKALYKSTRDGEEPEPEPPSREAKIWAFAGYDTIFIRADWFESGKYTAIKRDNSVKFIKRDE